ncbi:helix-turn-helix transcriptional regulator [Sinorhizobium medicae]|uniref:helix-turn-helix transcriptional regulator n=1 Tax=Sinorhizobium medicae TaxID=110321 RepID=UPI003C787E10
MGKSQADKDVHVTMGNNIRRFREISGISQKKLGAAIGVTFQQVQKYESGKDRISAWALRSASRFSRYRSTRAARIGFQRASSSKPRERLVVISTVFLPVSRLAT